MWLVSILLVGIVLRKLTFERENNQNQHAKDKVWGNPSWLTQLIKSAHTKETGLWQGQLQQVRTGDGIESSYGTLACIIECTLTTDKGLIVLRFNFIEI